jgi:hypothetical protein
VASFLDQRIAIPDEFIYKHEDVGVATPFPLPLSFPFFPPLFWLEVFPAFPLLLLLPPLLLLTSLNRKCDGGGLSDGAIWIEDIYRFWRGPAGPAHNTNRAVALTLRMALGVVIW